MTAMLDSLAACSAAELHARLAADGPQRVAVVCASHRQAQALLDDHAQARRAAGAEVWETPRVLSLAAFASRLHAESRAQFALDGVSLPPLLADSEVRVLWRLCIAESRDPLPLLRAADAAQLAAEAWNLCHEYRLPLPLDAGGFADVERFNGWALSYRRRLERLGALDAPLFDAAL
ncbi:MAG: hypothetical protein ACREVL_18040, partial [Solimonas sp.]